MTPLPPSVPSNSGRDHQRLVALRRYEILGTDEEAAFDRIVDLAARLLGMPMAGIHFVSDRCQWAKAQTGFQRKEVDLNTSFCARALDTESLLVVDDATVDPRFCENPFVTGAPGIRFYAGAALTTPNGIAIGRLCVLDTAPRPGGLTEDEQATLQQLADVIIDQLEYRAQPRHREEILESITDGFIAVDSEWTVTYLNQRAAEFVQRSSDEMIGEHLWEEFPEEKELIVYKRLQLALEELEAVQFESYSPSLEAWFDVKAYPLDKGGLSIYFDDITERHAREQQLKLMSCAVKDAAESVIITEGAPIDEPGPRIEYVNPAFEEMTGYSAEEVIGKTPRILQGPDTNRGILNRVRTCLEEGKPVTSITGLNYRKDGTPFWVEWSITPVRGDGGTVEHWVSVQRDITQRRELTETLREREEYLSVTLNSIGDAVISTDTSGRITEMNRVAEDLTGWTAEEADGHALREVVDLRDPATGKPVESSVGEVLESGDIVGMNNNRVLHDREEIERQIADSAAPIRSREGELLGVVLVFRDVTDAYQRRQALEEQRERLEMAIVGGRAGMWDWNMQTDATVYDERWAAILGYTLDELEYDNTFFERHTHPDDLQSVYDDIEAHARGELSYLDQEIRMRHKDGSWRWVLDRGKIVEWDEDGNPLRMVGTHVDITERKQAEEELRKSEERFDLAVRGSKDGLWDWDLKNGEVWYSDRFIELIGWPPDVFDQTLEAWKDVLHPDDVEPTMKAIEEHLHDRTPYDVEYRCRSKDGTYRWFQARGQAIWNEEGEPVRVAGSITDITERRRQISIEQRFGRLLEAVPSEIYVFDAETLEFVQTSRGARENLGYEADELAELTPLDLKPYDLETFEEVLAPLRSGEKEIVIFETTHQRKDGSSYPVQVRLQLNRGEVRPRFIAIVLDITERKERERELIQAKEQAEEMSRLKSSFLANMSHEIRTPLTAIIGFTEVLQDEIEGENYDLLSMIFQSGRRLERTLTSVLDLAQLESKTVEMKAETVDLTEEVREALSLFQKDAEDKGLRLEADVPGQPVMASTDRGAIHRVLANLISNAVKFTDDGGVRVGLHPADEHVCIEVEDTGIGIDEAFAEKIFHEFTQESEGYTRTYEGVGLGLHITHRLVDLLGGRITLESEKGKGSLFTITLPYEPEDNPCRMSADAGGAKNVSE
ncbi:hypothetical protein CRI94_15540 [Longibacter salinarum]|uniref:histidine kinase n=1 Tax=Longibacter salinarum TaxID=1850348 RepID=A0A2A8CUM2_9BACT|nr:PAS domain S-box protein [Longibacter salinarum]PEN11447.1 hypothetical protein CRI94_15540 [Longibacter salinarum]